MYIVRNIFNISSGLTCGCCCGLGFPRRRAGLGAGAALSIGATAGLGSAFATALAVKAPSGSSPDPFFTSLRTLVSLMMCCLCQKPDRQGGPLSERALPNGRASDTLPLSSLQTPLPKSLGTLPPCPDGRVMTLH